MAGPLAGLRLLDLGRYQAGPRCALMFARMGAEVIKVESPTGDESRKNSPRVRGQSAYWVQYNSGKKSLAVNLRTDEGKDILRDLVGVSDFFLQNFRPGTIDAMGFGYEALRGLNQGIIMINVSAYGAVRSLQRQGGIRPHRPGPGRHDDYQRIARRPPGTHQLPSDRQDHSPSRGDRRACGAEGARPLGRGPVPSTFAWPTRDSP